jgi:Tol biopolymer transport system component
MGLYFNAFPVYNQLMLFPGGKVMQKSALYLFIIVVLFGCTSKKPGPGTVAGGFIDRHMKNVTQLTQDGDNGEAYFSPDGKRLIFQSSHANGRDYACDKILIMNIDGSDKHLVSPDRGAHTCSFFYPDATRIVFASTSGIAGECPPRPETPKSARYVWPLYPYDIYSAKPDGSDLKRLTDNPKYDAEPVVSPDGGQVVFGSQREGNFDVYVMDIDGSNVRRLTDRMGYNGGPWFSPDGKKIVWRAWYPETAEEKALWKDCMDKDYIVAVPLDLWVMNADGSDKRLVLHNGATNFAPSWHPDGKRIIFSSNKDDWKENIKQYGHNFELYLINIDGTGLVRITDNTTFDSFPMFSPDGKKLVWASNRNPGKPRQTDIFIADWEE